MLGPGSALGVSVICTYSSTLRDGRQAWVAGHGAPLPVGGPKLVPTTAGSSWPGRGGPHYSASPAGALQRSTAPVIAASTPATPAFSNGQQPQTGAPSTAPAHTKTSTVGASSRSSKGSFSSPAVMSGVVQPITATTDFNTQIKYTTTLFIYLFIYYIRKPAQICIQ